MYSIFYESTEKDGIWASLFGCTLKETTTQYDTASTLKVVLDRWYGNIWYILQPGDTYTIYRRYITSTQAEPPHKYFKIRMSKWFISPYKRYLHIVIEPQSSEPMHYASLPQWEDFKQSMTFIDSESSRLYFVVVIVSCPNFIFLLPFSCWRLRFLNSSYVSQGRKDFLNWWAIIGTITKSASVSLKIKIFFIICFENLQVAPLWQPHRGRLVHRAAPSTESI